METYTPEILWHGGAHEHGKPDPVYSIDLHPVESLLATGGIDDGLPAKGTVRLWSIEGRKRHEFLLDLNEHASVVNSVRFSPCGKMLATASERQVIIYIVKSTQDWLHIHDNSAALEKIRLQPSLNEIYDLGWSPDSTYIVIGALDSKAEIIRVKTRDSLILPGHTSYVQGVAWDPLNSFVATESADRSCKIHMIDYKENTMVKLGKKGNITMKTFSPSMVVPAMNSNNQTSTEQVDITEKVQIVDGKEATSSSASYFNLFADCNVPSFFRRMAFTPDGSLLIAPTGIYRQPMNNSKSYCTHIFHRNKLATPCVSLAGLEEPSIAVRVCPRLFKLSNTNSNNKNLMFQGEYRMIFCVLTISSIYIYDTQHLYPIAKMSGLHFAAINDATWSNDGRQLIVCSTDGYLTFVYFEDHVFGEMLDEKDVPETVKSTHPAIYQSGVTTRKRHICDDIIIKASTTDSNNVHPVTPSSSQTIVNEEGNVKQNQHKLVTKSPAVIVLDGVEADATEPPMKKKRVQPTLVSTLEQVPTVVEVSE